MKPTDTITGNDEALHEANDRLKHLIARTATVPGQIMTAIEGLALPCLSPSCAGLAKGF